jgi:hypothetical protein
MEKPLTLIQVLSVLKLPGAAVAESQKKMIRTGEVNAYDFEPWRRVGQIAKVAIRRRPLQCTSTGSSEHLSGNGPEVLIDELLLQ